ncbi:MAG TPA: 50S ribosomal protein L24, partial [Bacteroidetes bacterium]|nr:50S ribosomal protein L24 [Bacteroidota bacterium]
MRIKKGDQVMVTEGAYKGKKGRVLEVYPAKSRVLVEGVNIVKKHQKP